MVIGVCMCRDEADIIGHVVGHMVGEVDHVIVSDNASVDGTFEILEGLDVEVRFDRNPVYHHGRAMTALTQLARERGAQWVVPFDADELWYSHRGRLADVLEGIGMEYNVTRAALYGHESTVEDPPLTSPIRRMGWRDLSASAFCKVAVRVDHRVRVGVGNHEAFFYGGDVPRPVDGLVEIRHYPYRSADQFVRKIVQGYTALVSSSAHAEVGAHWRRFGAIYDREGEEGLRAVFDRECLFRNPAQDDRLTFDPWPERYEHGAASAH